MWYRDRRQPVLVDVQDWSQWPYVVRAGHPNVAQFTPWGYPTIQQTNAYNVIGFPPRPRKVNHTLHLIVSVLTGGAWLPVWLIITATVHTVNSRADAAYWFKIQQYWQWERVQQRANIPRPRELPQGG